MSSVNFGRGIDFIRKYEDTNNNGYYDSGDKELEVIKFYDTDNNKLYDKFEIKFGETNSSQSPSFTVKELKEEFSNTGMYEFKNANANPFEVKDGKMIIPPGQNDLDRFYATLNKMEAEEQAQKKVPTITPTPTTTAKVTPTVTQTVIPASTLFPIFNQTHFGTIVGAIATSPLPFGPAFDGLVGAALGYVFSDNLNYLKNLQSKFTASINAQTSTANSSGTSGTSNTSGTSGTSGTGNEGAENPAPIKSKSVTLSRKIDTTNGDDITIETNLNIEKIDESKDGDRKKAETDAYYKDKINQAIKDYDAAEGNNCKRQRLLATIARWKYYLDQNHPDRDYDAIGEKATVYTNLGKWKKEESFTSSYATENYINGKTIAQIRKEINDDINIYNNASDAEKVKLACSIAQLKDLLEEFKTNTEMQTKSKTYVQKVREDKKFNTILNSNATIIIDTIEAIHGLKKGDPNIQQGKIKLKLMGLNDGEINALLTDRGKIKTKLSNAKGLLYAKIAYENQATKNFDKLIGANFDSKKLQSFNKTLRSIKISVKGYTDIKTAYDLAGKINNLTIEYSKASDKTELKNEIIKLKKILIKELYVHGSTKL